MVYIAEAHAKDIWPLGTLESLPSHEIIQDRLNAAQILLSKYKSKIPMLLDTMSDEFDSEYAIWPERYYVIRAGKIEHVFMPTHEFGFDHEEMYALLQKISSPPEAPVVISQEITTAEIPHEEISVVS